MISLAHKLQNPFIVFFYRLCKVCLYRIIYNTFLYKFFFPHSIKAFIQPEKKYKLVVCHNGGGGTVSYMKNKYQGKAAVIFLRNAVTADKDYIYSLENSDTEKKIYIRPKQLAFLNNNINEVHVIAVESYMSLSFILPWFVSLNVPVTYDLHDYHCVWYETHFIHDGKYLTKADLEKSSLRYVTRKITFTQWHQIWADFFPHVNSITAFSNSSKEIFSEFYPQFTDKVNVTPHSLDYIKCNKLESLPKKFTIGIFGMILGADKGSLVLKSFLEFSKDKDYHIFINGQLNSSCLVNAPNIHYMGPYDVAKLDKIIMEQGISVVLFPSICPETFSYTVSELIHVGIPVASFNLGAQAEKLASYKYGQIITENTNEAILTALQVAYEKGQKGN